VRHLVVMTPGGFERFFVEMAAAERAAPLGAPAAAAIAARFRARYVGPALEPE
jgi:hypothetical protein